jgi:hypothetical protein
MVSFWHECDIARSRMDFRFRGKSGRAADITGTTEFETELRHCSLLSRIAYRNVAPLLGEK